MVHNQAHEDAKLPNGITTFGKRIQGGTRRGERHGQVCFEAMCLLYALLFSVPQVIELTVTLPCGVIDYRTSRVDLEVTNSFLLKTVEWPSSRRVKDTNNVRWNDYNPSIRVCTRLSTCAITCH